MNITAEQLDMIKEAGKLGLIKNVVNFGRKMLLPAKQMLGPTGRNAMKTVGSGFNSVSDFAGKVTAPLFAYQMLGGGFGGGGDETPPPPQAQPFNANGMPGYSQPQGYTGMQPYGQMPKYSELDEESRKYFDLGVEVFCKEAGFDEDDRAALQDLMEKDAILPLILGGLGAISLGKDIYDWATDKGQPAQTPQAQHAQNQQPFGAPNPQQMFGEDFKARQQNSLAEKGVGENMFSTAAKGFLNYGNPIGLTYNAGKAVWDNTLGYNPAADVMNDASAKKRQQMNAQYEASPEGQAAHREKFLKARDEHAGQAYQAALDETGDPRAAASRVMSLYGGGAMQAALKKHNAPDPFKSGPNPGLRVGGVSSNNLRTQAPTVAPMAQENAATAASVPGGRMVNAPSTPSQSMKAQVGPSYKPPVPPAKPAANAPSGPSGVAPTSFGAFKGPKAVMEP